MTEATTQTSSALAEARAIYVDPLAVARAAQARGVRLCGIIGADVPEELILAAGFLPVRVRGEAVAGAECAGQHGYLAEPVTCAMLAHLVDGSYDYLDGLVIDRSLEAHTTLFFQLRQIPRWSLESVSRTCTSSICCTCHISPRRDTTATACESSPTRSLPGAAARSISVRLPAKSRPAMRGAPS